MAKSASAISIIGGADGPTSVFIAGKGIKDKNIIRRMKNNFRNKQWQRKKRKAERSIVVGAHSLQETIQYTIERYGAVEADCTHQEYKTRRNALRCSLIQREKPELIGAQTPLPPENFDRKNMEELQKWMKEVDRRARSCEQKAASLPEEAFPMEYYLYFIEKGENGHMAIEIETGRRILSISYSGKKEMLQPIVKDIYRYYGVTKEDIATKSDRYKALVMELAM